MNFMPNNWVILKDEYMDINKKEGLGHSFYAEKVKKVEITWDNKYRVFLWRKETMILIFNENFRLATDKEIKVSKIKNIFI